MLLYSTVIPSIYTAAMISHYTLHLLQFSVIISWFSCLTVPVSVLVQYFLLLYHYLKYAIVIGPTRVT